MAAEHQLIKKFIRIRPNGGDTEIFLVQTAITKPSLQLIDRHGRSFIIPDRDYPLATPDEIADYWKSRAAHE